MKKASFFLFYLISNFAGLYLELFYQEKVHRRIGIKILIKHHGPHQVGFLELPGQALWFVSLYMAELHLKVKNILPLYVLLWSVNLSWNPFFSTAMLDKHVSSSVSSFFTLYSFLNIFPF